METEVVARRQAASALQRKRNAYPSSRGFRKPQPAHTAPAGWLLLLDGASLAQLLGYADSLDALHVHCRIEGFVFGNQPRPTIWIDIRNAHRLVFHSELPLAERLAHWISHWLLPYFSNRRSQPHIRRTTIGEQQLRVLHWRDECWLSLNGTMQLLGTTDQALLHALADLRASVR
ncbi:hypothetical protein [Pseudomonas sp. BAY1663]|uniref:hypothetical protein n=1 Tax=Pseudomonas sp. BAY1663 TaxID=1439940 RepID=UPI00210BE265|nr:hypothetical protein [Pseudomonas sp. BAY1663]